MDYSTKILALTDKLFANFDATFFGEKHQDLIILKDHLRGWTKNLENEIFEFINYCGSIDSTVYEVKYHQFLEPHILEKYPYVKYNFSSKYQQKMNFLHFLNYKIHPDIKYKNFLCSFNGSAHVSRQLLTSILNNQNYFNSEYSSKNFAQKNESMLEQLNLLDLTENEIRTYRKFFNNIDDFCDNVYSFGHVRFEHNKNIYNLESKLTESFIHVVSETLATSYYPFVTEKFLYSIITRGLFLSYAQPGWHAYIKKYYGFKLYDTIFDYSFDQIQNPVKRLTRLIEMISKFSTLSSDDWRDLYLIEEDNIKHNYEHYFSGNYLKCLARYE